MNSSCNRPWESFREKFSFEHQTIEGEVEALPALNQGLSEEALYTSFEDLHRLFQHPLVNGTWVDLGCGVGKSVLAYGSSFPNRRAVGIEFSEARFAVARELASPLPNVTVLRADLLTCPIPSADTYFLYFPTGPVLDRILAELHRLRRGFRLVAIESHGDLLPRLDLEKWLRLVDEVPLASLRHYPKARIYQRQSGDLFGEGHAYSFQRKFLEIDGLWLGESFGLERQGGDYLLQTPPRTIRWCQVSGIKDLEDYPSLVQFLLKLRHFPNLRLLTSSGAREGSLRKIFLAQGISLEISSGETIEWGDVCSIFRGNYLCYEASSSSFSLPPVL